MLVPSSEFTSDQSSSSYFVGYQNGTSADSLRVFPFSSSGSVLSTTGGSFEFKNTSGSMSLVKSWSNSVQLVASDLAARMNRFQTVSVNISSISVVLNGYTYGFGTTGTQDYAWVFPNHSFSTFLNQIRLTGTVVDQATITAVADTYAQSLISGIDFSKVSQAAAKLNFTFSGSFTKLLLVSSIEYSNTVKVKGDVLDTIVPNDFQKLGAGFLNNGTRWIENMSSSIQEGFAVVSAQPNNITSSDLWFMLYPTGTYSSFSGICNFTVSPTDLSLLLQKTSNLASEAFDYLGSMSGFYIRLGVVLGVNQEPMAELNVTGLWQGVESAHSYAQVSGADVKGYAMVMDLNSLAGTLGSALDVGPQVTGELSRLATFRNPAVALMIDDSVPSMLSNGVEPWKYFALAFLSNFDHSNTGLRYLDVKGVLYDPMQYLSLSHVNASIPILVADQYSDFTGDLQSLTVKNLVDSQVALDHTSEHDSAYVQFDAMVTGVNGKNISDLADFIPGGAAVAQVVKEMPFDACVYSAMQFQNLTTIYEVPVLYLAKPTGEMIVTPTQKHIEGIYVDTAAIFARFQNYVQNHTRTVLPTGGLDLSFLVDATQELASFQKDIVNRTLVAPGYVLAFEVSDSLNTPPILSITAPINGSSVAMNDFDLTFTCSDYPDLPLWAELTVSSPYLLGLPSLPIPLVLLRNGAWTTGDLPYWSAIKAAVASLMIVPGWPYELTFTVKATDFDMGNYSNAVSVTISLTM